MNHPPSHTATFWQGFRAGIPLWLAAAPYAVAYVIAARSAGLNGLETQLMSLSVYSAAAQIAIAQFIITHASPLTILFTVFLMNLHNVLYGLSLSGQVRFTCLQKAAAAFGLTDFAFGATVAQPENTQLAFLLGIELSIYLSWNLCTGAAILFEPILHSLGNLHVDFIIPLTFFLLLLSTLKRRLHVAVAAVSMALTFVGSFLGNSVLFVGLLGPILGLGLSNILKSKD